MGDRSIYRLRRRSPESRYRDVDEDLRVGVCSTERVHRQSHDGTSFVAWIALAHQIAYDDDVQVYPDDRHESGGHLPVGGELPREDGDRELVVGALAKSRVVPVE